ncbi:MAG: nuclear transport factor 2 family protein [Hyphomicrobiaceae bacterium]
MTRGNAGDITAIRDLIQRQFQSMSWESGATGDWDAFAQDFHRDATLFASSRPVRAQSVDAFTHRMQRLVGTALKSFHERVLGVEVRVFGSVAVASVACENTENGSEINRNVEMMLLIKDEERWQIVAQAWDKANVDRPVPADLID